MILSSVRAKTTAPMGAYPYKYVSYDNKIVYMEANEYYYKGAPKTKNLQWKTTSEADKLPGVVQELQILLLLLSPRMLWHRSRVRTATANYPVTS